MTVYRSVRNFERLAFEVNKSDINEYTCDKDEFI